jgi:hypothetical protein
MRTRTTATTLTTAAILASAALAGGAAAKPHVAATYKLPGGLPAGGAIVQGPDGAMYAATGVKPTPHKASKIVRITGKGKISQISLPVPTGMDVDGLGVGADHKVWVSGIMDGEPYTGYSGEISGATARLKKASDSAHWSSVAVVGATTYAADGFGTIYTAPDAQTFNPSPLSGTEPFALAARGGDLFAAGDGNVGVIPAGQTAATPLTSPDAAVTLGSRSLAVAHGDVWFPIATSNGATAKAARVNPDNSVTLITLPAPATAVTTGPGGDAWFATIHGVLRVNAAGKVTGRLTLPGGLSIDGIAGGPANTLWVQAYARSPGGRVVKIKP